MSDDPRSAEFAKIEIKDGGTTDKFLGVTPPNPANPQTPYRPHPAQTWLEGVLTAVGSHHAGLNGKWQCPVHGRAGDHSVSLGVGTRRDGMGAWVYCHHGCDVRDVMASLRLTLAHLAQPPAVSPVRHVQAMRVKVGFPPPKFVGAGSPRQQGFRHECFHSYGENWRKERLRHPITGAKTLSWESRDERGAWIPGLRGVREVDLPMYREHDVVIGMAMGEPVLLMESESSVDALTGWYATTWAGGASSLPLDHVRLVLGGYEHVLIVPDNDAAGLQCLDVLLAALPLATYLIPDIAGEDPRDLHTRIGPLEFTRRVDEALAAPRSPRGRYRMENA